MKSIVATLLLLVSSTAFAGGWTSIATPTRVDIERAGGFMVYGNFGNPEGCVVKSKFYVLSSHPQYKEIYTAVMTAFTHNKKIQAYVHTCAPVDWYADANTTWNIVGDKGAVNISN
jgi:hypothetical protein